MNDVLLYVCPGMYVVENCPWIMPKGWVSDGGRNYHTDSIDPFISLVHFLKVWAIPYTARRLSFVPSHIVSI